MQTRFRSIVSIIFSYGGAFVECSLAHPTEVEIVQLVFRVNEVHTTKDSEANVLSGFYRVP